MRAPSVAIETIEARAYRIPTDRPEADGTYAWDATTLVVIHAGAGGTRGIGYTYGSAAIVPLVRGELAPRVIGGDALAVERAWNAMVREVRNVGRPGIASTAISAVDAALWDLKAKLLGAVVILIVVGLGLFGWVGYQLFTTGFSAKTEPHALEVLMARQIRH